MHLLRDLSENDLGLTSSAVSDDMVAAFGPHMTRLARLPNGEVVDIADYKGRKAPQLLTHYIYEQIRNSGELELDRPTWLLGGVPPGSNVTYASLWNVGVAALVISREPAEMDIIDERRGRREIKKGYWTLRRLDREGSIEESIEGNMAPVGIHPETYGVSTFIPTDGLGDKYVLPAISDFSDNIVPRNNKIKNRFNIRIGKMQEVVVRSEAGLHQFENTQLRVTTAVPTHRIKPVYRSPETSPQGLAVYATTARLVQFRTYAIPQELFEPSDRVYFNGNEYFWRFTEVPYTFFENIGRVVRALTGRNQ